MTYQQLFSEIAAIMFQADEERDFFIAPSGLEERYTLGEKGMAGYHLIDATPDEILSFVKEAVRS